VDVRRTREGRAAAAVEVDGSSPSANLRGRGGLREGGGVIKCRARWHTTFCKQDVSGRKALEISLAMKGLRGRSIVQTRHTQKHTHTHTHPHTHTQMAFVWSYRDVTLCRSGGTAVLQWCYKW
jgi:hypothetical protein